MPSKNKNKKKDGGFNERKGGPLVTTCSNGTKSKNLEQTKNKDQNKDVVKVIQNKKKNQVTAVEKNQNQNLPPKSEAHENSKMSRTCKENVQPIVPLSSEDLQDSRDRDELKRKLRINYKHNLKVHKFTKRGFTNAHRMYTEFVRMIEKGEVDTETIHVETMSHPTLLYNLAVQFYQCKQFENALGIVNQLLIVFKGEDELSLMLALLDISICMRLQKLHHALYRIGRLESRLVPLEKAPVVRNIDPNAQNSGIKKKKLKRKLFELPSDDFEIGVRLSIQLKKTECLLRTFDVTTAKREYKKCLNLTNSIPKNQLTPRLKEMITLQSHLKTFMEFLTGHPRKVLTLITNIAYKEAPPSGPLGLSSLTNPDNVQYFMNTGDNLGIILNNNAGCCYQAMGQYVVGGWYSQHAWDECDNSDYKVKEKLPMFCLSYNLKYEVLYNHALASLYAKKPYPAYYYLWYISREVFAYNPRVWLHLAECCVQIHAARLVGLKSKASLMEPLNIFRPVCPSTGKFVRISPQCFPPAPTLQYALKCITKALKLVDPAVIDKCIGLEVPPCDPVTSPKQRENITSTILITGLYIALLKKKYLMVISFYKRLTQLRSIRRTYLCLARQYLAVALHAMGQRKKSHNIFLEESATNYSFVRSENNAHPYPDSGPPQRNNNHCSGSVEPDKEMAVYDAFVYNHAVADFKMGDVQSARRIVQVWLATAKQERTGCFPKFVKLWKVIEKLLKTNDEKKFEAGGDCKPKILRKVNPYNNKMVTYRENEPPQNYRIQQLRKQN